jgi:hypothetical protein
MVRRMRATETPRCSTRSGVFQCDKSPGHDGECETRDRVRTDDHTINVRVTAVLLARLDEERSRVCRATPGRAVSRSDVVRMLILRGFDVAS